MSPIEILAIIASLGGVVFSMAKKSLAWVCNIIASGLYGYIFYQNGLYSDMELQGFFILMAVYGWWTWSRSERDWVPEKSSRRVLFIGLAVALLFGAGSGFLHQQYFTDVSFPFLDATLTGLSIYGTWLATRRKIENWIVWIGVDIVYVGMYVNKGLWGTAALYLVFIALALKGYIDWLKPLKNRD
ncbi:nicotinamide mononucleotide transporter [Aquirufa antheringensis]|uniref:nicotinamide riboside transporter PnuC n=1 Tax=Aquirufa antheringensis TaxID=2516559 RepID=UPI0022A8CF34|nr:nicotinamide riboside transporter PnuC [Aquirufa antheringensis]MCZ2477406.1 nicotinamide mononucleotide transporter [Aquirufa antheringensis]